MRKEDEKEVINKIANVIRMLTNKIEYDLDGEPCETFPRKYEGFINTLDCVEYRLRDIRKIIECEINKSEEANQ